MSASTPAPLPASVRAFLAGSHCATIATVDPDGSPHQAVIWYLVEDDTLVVNSRADRHWPANLERERRAAVAVVDLSDPLRWVGLTGDVVGTVGGARAQADIAAMARIFDPTEADRLIRDFERQERVSFRLRITGHHDHLS